MNKAEKQEFVNTFKKNLAKAKLAIFADYKGLSSADADQLRKVLREKKADVKVIKNNLARLVTKEGEFGEPARDLMDKIVGPTLVAFAYEDIAAVAKAVDAFEKDHQAFAVKESLMEQKKVTPADIKDLASLPSKEVLIAKILAGINTPATNIVSILAAVQRSLVRVLAEIEKKKSNTSG